LIKASLKGEGKIYDNGNGAYQYRVSSIKDLIVIIAHFYNSPLITQKLIDYDEFFKQIFELIYRKEHLSKEGLDKIVALRLKSSMNKGL
jgi:hypothetical protein